MKFASPALEGRAPELPDLFHGAPGPPFPTTIEVALGAPEATGVLGVYKNLPAPPPPPRPPPAPAPPPITTVSTAYVAGVVLIKEPGVKNA